MTARQEQSGDHEQFEQLIAFALADSLTAEEWFDLKAHLPKCEDCSEIYREYLVLCKQGLPVLGADYHHTSEHESWDGNPTRERLFARITDAHAQSSQVARASCLMKPAASRHIGMPTLAKLAFAACLIVAVGVSAFRLGSKRELDAKRAEAWAEDRFQKLAAEKKSADELLAAQAAKLTELQEQSAQQEQDLGKLHQELLAAEAHSAELAASKDSSEDQLRAASQRQESLSAQLRDAEEAYQRLQAELTTLRAERDKAVLRAASLESSFQSKVAEIATLNRDRDRRLKDDEEYLASDRDIREMMGARQLYIADVFDVDSSSRTKKPYGRVFYAKGKSLLFYAFDLDRQLGEKNAKTFQAWGERETPQGEPTRPTSLGILYLDNEANRRWALRCDDPKQLAEIDAVFVTVEPHGGSQKPTSKPFLYALLRREANHP